MAKKNLALRVNHVSMKFNLSSQKVDNIKDDEKRADVSGILGAQGCGF